MGLADRLTQPRKPDMTQVRDIATRELKAEELDCVAGGAAGETPEQQARRLWLEDMPHRLRPEHLYPVRVPPNP